MLAFCLVTYMESLCSVVNGFAGCDASFREFFVFFFVMRTLVYLSYLISFHFVFFSPFQPFQASFFAFVFSLGRLVCVFPEI